MIARVLPGPQYPLILVRICFPLISAQTLVHDRLMPCWIIVFVYISDQYFIVYYQLDLNERYNEIPGFVLASMPRLLDFLLIISTQSILLQHNQLRFFVPNRWHQSEASWLPKQRYNVVGKSIALSCFLQYVLSFTHHTHDLLPHTLLRPQHLCYLHFPSRKNLIKILLIQHQLTEIGEIKQIQYQLHSQLLLEGFFQLFRKHGYELRVSTIKNF